MGFKQQMESITAIMERRPARAVVEEAPARRPIAEGRLEEDWNDTWNDATMAYFLGGVMEEMVASGHIPELVEAAMELVIERAMDPISPEEKDVSGDVGTIDEPPQATIPRGFKGNPAGLAPTYVETQRVIAQQLMKMAPKSVGELPIEDINDLWAEVCGQLINMGKAISIETRKDGTQVVGPNYGLAWSLLKKKLAKSGIEIAASKEKTIVKDAEDLVKKSAQVLGAMKKSGEVSAQAAATASSMLRGAKQKKARKGTQATEA